MRVHYPSKIDGNVAARLQTVTTEPNVGHDLPIKYHGDDSEQTTAELSGPVLTTSLTLADQEKGGIKKKRLSTNNPHIVIKEQTTVAGEKIK